MRQLRNVLPVLALLVGIGGAPSSGAADNPVIVELFTSQGCNSCPPADEYLAELAKRENVIALSMHVDYWDYLGWRDTFAQEKFSQRQYDYRSAWRTRVVYTPQMVVHGHQVSPGSGTGEVEQAINSLQTAEPAIDIAIEEYGEMLKAVVSVAPRSFTEGGTIWVARYDREETVKIRRGENAGRTITYHNIVRELLNLGPWNGEEARKVEIPTPRAGEGLVVWVQSYENGPIVAAAEYQQPGS